MSAQAQVRDWTHTDGVHSTVLADSGLRAQKKRSAFGCSQTRDITVDMASTSWDWSDDRWVQAAIKVSDPNNTWRGRTGRAGLTRRKAPRACAFTGFYWLLLLRDARNLRESTQIHLGTRSHSRKFLHAALIRAQSVMLVERRSLLPELVGLG